MATGGIGALATVVVLVAGGGIVGMFAVEVVVSAVNLVWTARLARRVLDGVGDDEGEGFGQARTSFMRYLRGSNVDVIVGLVVFRRSEFFFLDRYGTDADIAFYSVAFATVTAFVRVFDGFAGVLAPAFASMFGADAGVRIRNGFGRALRLLTMLALPGAAGAAIVGPRLIDIAYGRDYHPAGRIFLVLVAVLPVLALVGVGHALLVGMGQIRVVVIAGIAAAIVNLGLDFVLVPRYGGVGAALANNAAQLTAGVPALVVAWRRAGGVRWRLASMVVVLMTSAVTAGGAWLGLHLAGGALGALAALTIGGAVAMAGLLTAIRLQPDDAAWVPDVLPERLAPLARRLLPGPRSTGA
jgi:O-antigen/teichoic acid export membrane protein